MHITGILRQVKGSLLINIQHISPIHSFDQIQLHYFNIFLYSLFKHHSNIQIITQSNRVIAPPPFQSPNKSTFDFLLEDLPSNQALILNLIKQYGNQSSEGIQIDQLCQHLKESNLTKESLLYFL